MKKASELIAALKHSHVYKDGRQFSVEEAHRSVHVLKPLTTSRVRQLLNRMVDDGDLEKIPLDEGHMSVEYRQRGSLRATLNRLWHKVPTQAGHSTRWC